MSHMFLETHTIFAKEMEVIRIGLQKAAGLSNSPYQLLMRIVP